MLIVGKDTKCGDEVSCHFDRLQSNSPISPDSVARVSESVTDSDSDCHCRSGNVGSGTESTAKTCIVQDCVISNIADSDTCMGKIQGIHGTYYFNIYYVNILV